MLTHHLSEKKKEKNQIKKTWDPDRNTYREHIHTNPTALVRNTCWTRIRAGGT